MTTKLKIEWIIDIVFLIVLATVLAIASAPHSICYLVALAIVGIISIVFTII